MALTREQVLDTLNTRPDSANHRLAELLLEGEWWDKTELAERADANINAVPRMVRELRNAGAKVRSRENPRTKRISYFVSLGGEPTIKEVKVADTQTPEENSGPNRIRFSGGQMWAQVTIPGIGPRWGRLTEDGDLVDLQVEEP